MRNRSCLAKLKLKFCGFIDMCILLNKEKLVLQTQNLPGLLTSSWHCNSVRELLGCYGILIKNRDLLEAIPEFGKLWSSFPSYAVFGKDTITTILLHLVCFSLSNCFKSIREVILDLIYKETRIPWAKIWKNWKT